MSKIGSYDPFGHLKHKLWPKERPRVKLVVWLPTTKSQESARFPRVQVACDIPLESSQRGLQRFFWPHFNWRSAHKVIGVQTLGISKLPFGSLETKCHLNVGLVERHKVYYKGEGGDFHQVRAVMGLVSWVRVCSWLVLAPKVLKLCINQLVVWIVQVRVSNWCLSLFLVPIPKLQHPVLPPKCYEPGSLPQLLVLPLFFP
jgi:hypothetical protein